MVIATRELIGALVRGVDLPVLTQEMRIRQRGVKPFAVMFVYVAVLSIIALITLSTTAPQAYHGGNLGQGTNLARQGRTLFTVLAMAQLVMISLLVPAYSAGAVSTERDRGTFDLLALTLLSSASIVAQKLAAAIAQAVILTLTSLPVVALVFLLGGVSPVEMGAAYGLLCLTALAFGGLGLLCSCQFRNTRTSTFVAYLSVLGFLVGLPLLGVLLRSLTRMDALVGAFAPVFLLIFAFVAGACALPLFAVAAFVLKKRSRHWHSRTFRMWVFGGVYALTALLLESPVLSSPLVNGLLYYNDQLFLPTLANPFVAMSLLMQDDPMGYGWRGSLQCWSVGSTLVLGLAAAYVCRQMSAFRFEAMRRA